MTTERGGSPERIERVRVRVNQVRRILAGEDPALIGAALADLLAIWVAGHVGEDEQETQAYRDLLLNTHMDAVRQLVPPNAAIIHGQNGRKR